MKQKITRKYRQLLPSRLRQSTILLMTCVLFLVCPGQPSTLQYHISKHEKQGKREIRLQIIIHVDTTLKQAFHTASTALITLSDPVE
jgi:hypothetical protein